MHREYSYPLGGWVFPAAFVLWPNVLVVAFVWATVRYWSTAGVWLAGMGLMALFVSVAAYLSYPVAVTIESGNVSVRYLFGPTVTRSASQLSWKMYSHSRLLKASVRRPGKRSFIFGAFVLNLAWLRDNEELLLSLGIPEEGLGSATVLKVKGGRGR
jgi:hypothetical protein